MKAPSLPVSVIFPPTTWTQKRDRTTNKNLSSCGEAHWHLFSAGCSNCLTVRGTEKLRTNESLLTFRPSREPASRGTADLLLNVMRPIKWSPSLEGCHVTGCYRDKRCSSEDCSIFKEQEERGFICVNANLHAKLPDQEDDSPSHLQEERRETSYLLYH